MVPAETIQRMVAFIESIGIPVIEGELPERVFVPGIWLDKGRLVVDYSKLTYPGDLLHEAGHIAVMLPEQRMGISVDASNNAGDEIAAICWSYAAARHIGVDSRVLFHENGYKGDGAWLAETFDRGNYVGLPLLQWMGLTWDEQRAAEHDAEPYPHMVRWLRGPLEPVAEA
ncbi:MAG: hypothetical protein H6980_03460 [Gammaproteobacteria bacterium]|nr:hypothetical protein [Gammaproteobacteria bacterium]